MGAYQGNYTRGGDPEAMFDEELRYLMQLVQSGVPVVDADFNDHGFSTLTQLRRVIQTVIGSSAPNNGFKIEESLPNTNNFTIRGGDGTGDGAGRLFVAGYPCVLFQNVNYFSNPADSRLKRIMPQSSALAPTVLTDSSASWVPNALIGRTLTPNVDAPASTYTILSNTATTITIAAGDMTLVAAARDYYRVELSTPGAPRVDEVYLDVFVDEIDDVEDPNLVHVALAPAQAANFRLVLRQIVRVVEGGAAPANYVDLDGRQHYCYLLATLTRVNGDNTVTTAMIADERQLYTPFGGLTVREADGAPSVNPTSEIVVTNDRLTDLGGGTASLNLEDPTRHYLRDHNFEAVAGSPSGTIAPVSLGGDFERYLLVTGNNPADSLRAVFYGKLAAHETEIVSIAIPLKGTGEYQIHVYVEGSGAANVYAASALTPAPGARTVTTILAAGLSAQPNAEKRFFVTVTALVDAAEELYIGTPYVIQR